MGILFAFCLLPWPLNVVLLNQQLSFPRHSTTERGIMGQKSLEVTAMGMEKPADKNANAQIKAYFCLKALFAICSWLEVKKKKTSTLRPKQVCPWTHHKKPSQRTALITSNWDRTGFKHSIGPPRVSFVPHKLRLVINDKKVQIMKIFLPHRAVNLFPLQKQPSTRSLQQSL